MNKPTIPSSSPPPFNLNQVFGTISVSSVFKDMIYVILAIIVLIGFLVFFKASTWIIIVAFAILIGVVYFFMRWYRDMLKTNPEALRSEKYNIQKQRLEMMGTKAKEISAQVVEGETVIERPKEGTQSKAIAAKGGNKK